VGCGAGEAPKPSAAAPQVPEAEQLITGELLQRHVTTIASDEYEGRGPGTDGDRRARAYLAERLAEYGAEPAFAGGSWEQPMTIVGITTDLPERWAFANGGGEQISFPKWDEYMGGIGVHEPQTSIAGAEVVFVGYGIEAPEQDWDDFKGADLRGKVLLMLNDDPDWDPELFEGERKLYYGRWVYKYESAARQGAAAAIIIHTTESAGYPWNVVQTGWDGEQFEIPAGDEPRLKMNAWMTEDAARRLAAHGGADLDELVSSARSREFRPVPLDLTTTIELSASIRETETANVGGIFPGGDPELADEFVIVSAHHDHFGIGEPDDTGDRIYNGALDNGVAVAQALALAEAVGRLDEPMRRSALFLFVAAEEQGRLGSEYYARNPSVPVGKIAADINFELGNVWGRTRDVTIFGMGKSTLEDVLADAAARRGRTVGPETTVRAGWYYRSDQFSFAKVGVPSIWFKSGSDFVGRPDGWGDERYAEWIENRYHQPSDEVEPGWNYEGLEDDARLGFELLWTVANADEMPSWYPGDEFEDERLRALAAVEE
jgi:Zn-dependent M28 family amino/carboxypeptidase